MCSSQSFWCSLTNADNIVSIVLLFHSTIPSDCQWLIEPQSMKQRESLRIIWCWEERLQPRWIFNIACHVIVRVFCICSNLHISWNKMLSNCTPWTVWITSFQWLIEPQSMKQWETLRIIWCWEERLQPHWIFNIACHVALHISLKIVSVFAVIYTPPETSCFRTVPPDPYESHMESQIWL
jgi:hypothetical protein